MSELYLQECDRLCIPPIAALTRALQERPDILDFTKLYIGDKQAIALAATFKVYHPKQVLLAFNGLMNFGTTAIVAALEGSNVQVIDLSRNDFSPSVVSAICKTIANTPSLQEVRVIQCCHLKPEHVKRIQDAYIKRPVQTVKQILVPNLIHTFMQNLRLGHTISTIYKLNAIRYILVEELDKLKRDQQELVRIGQDYKAPVQKALQCLQQTIVLKENELNQVGMQLKVFETQFQETDKVVEHFEETHQLQLQEFDHPDVAVTSQILQEFRK